MQLLILTILGLNLFTAPNANTLSTPEADEQVQIEILNASEIDFEFKIEYNQRRKIIKVQSDEPIRSLRTVNEATNSHKAYNVAGSDLIILPQSDFQDGIYNTEIKFMKHALIVKAKISVSEDGVANY